MATTAAAPARRRGAFIVFEGLDRSGKSTQVQRLVDALNARGVQTKGARFPGACGVSGGLQGSVTFGQYVAAREARRRSSTD
jgi:dTMP kinase